jgi:hypothetical protein
VILIFLLGYGREFEGRVHIIVLLKPVMAIQGCLVVLEWWAGGLRGPSFQTIMITISCLLNYPVSRMGPSSVLDLSSITTVI